MWLWGLIFFIIYVCIIIQYLCFVFFKKLVFKTLRYYGLSVLVYRYYLVRLWMEFFVWKGLSQLETSVSKKESTWSKRNENDIKIKINITWIYINYFIWYNYLPHNCRFIIALQYADNKFLQSGLQGNKCNNNKEIFMKPSTILSWPSIRKLFN